MPFGISSPVNFHLSDYIWNGEKALACRKRCVSGLFLYVAVEKKEQINRNLSAGTHKHARRKKVERRLNKNMRCKRRNNSRKFVKLFLTVLVIAIAILVIVTVWKIYKDNAGNAPTEEIVGGVSVEKGIVFPYELEDGKLEVNSLFQFSGPNPDCRDEDGENIASLEVTNKSEQYLASAEIEVSLESGNELRFEITDLPAEQSVMVFEKNNTSYETSDKCITVKDTAEFEETAALMEDRLAVDVQETSVTLTNTADEDLTNLLLHCHCLVDDTYFGGLTYSYPIESIPAGQSITVQADECYLGTASVVRISQDNGEE